MDPRMLGILLGILTLIAVNIGGWLLSVNGAVVTILALFSAVRQRERERDAEGELPAPSGTRVRHRTQRSNSGYGSLIGPPPGVRE
ncbi:hypothetical protein [Halomarina pelagica]|uniref:hypothetical protein n=1 Tax=Halomarina pelagica TaxID=2961599 RepID=UPI0020C53C10|nr:hypothetical protein [Halomarina sp. BND7]